MLAPYGLEAVLEWGGERTLRLLKRLTRLPNIHERSIRKMRELGARVGLSASEVDETMNNSGTPLISNLPQLVVIILVIIAIIIGVTYAIVPTYAPGTDYGSVKPQDFDGRKSFQ